MARCQEENKTDNEINSDKDGKSASKSKTVSILNDTDQRKKKNQPSSEKSVVDEDEFEEMKKKQENQQLERADKIANDMESFLKKNV